MLGAVPLLYTIFFNFSFFFFLFCYIKNGKNSIEEKIRKIRQKKKYNARTNTERIKYYDCDKFSFFERIFLYVFYFSFLEFIDSRNVRGCMTLFLLLLKMKLLLFCDWNKYFYLIFGIYGLSDFVAFLHWIELDYFYYRQDVLYIKLK